MVKFLLLVIALVPVDIIFFFQIFPSTFDDYANLRAWKGAAEILAKDDSWVALYDLEQLSKNEVKVSAATYVEKRHL